jgi:hypothetical protein
MPQMRLSDAIALGRTLIGKTDPSSYCGCALAMALMAIGKEPMVAAIGDDSFAEMAHDNWFEAAMTEWPWLVTEGLEVPKYLPAYAYEHYNAEYIISDLFWKVDEGEISLDQLIDWVRSVEPQEETERSPEGTEITETLEAAKLP